MIKKVIDNIDDLKREKELSSQKLDLHEEKLKAFYHIRTMNLLVPDIIRDENYKVDFTKAFAHLSIAAMPYVYNYLKDNENSQFSQLADLASTFMEGYQKAQHMAEKETPEPGAEGAEEGESGAEE